MFCLLVPLSVLTLFSSSADTKRDIEVDIYRTNQITVNEIYDRFSKELKEITNITESLGPNISEEEMRRIVNLKEKITAEIMKMANFSYINISPILYPESNKVYITIDMVDEKDKDRLSYFAPEPKQTISDPDNLILKWTEYTKLGIYSYYKKNKKILLQTKCPVYHCTAGFNEPELKKYENLFNDLVLKNKEQIIDVLRNDQDKNKRAAAAFLLAHIKDGKELVKILIPSMYDSSSYVRNNVMRVLGATLERVKVSDFPVDKVIVALDFPSETDRNKALYILLSLSNQPKYAKYIRTHAATLLINHLKMFQPNLHDGSYEVLTKISGKKYGERDYKAWQDWLDQASK